MKQIFDWLREQINEAHKLNKLRLGLGMKLDAPYNLFNEIINEAEVKWKADCCVWKYRSPASYAEAHKRWELISDVMDWWRFCPYCGKPIKISEVE